MKVALFAELSVLRRLTLFISQDAWKECDLGEFRCIILGAADIWLHPETSEPLSLVRSWGGKGRAQVSHAPSLLRS
jgi:hypothetical protein